MYNPKETITTSRLLLRKLRKDDALPMFKNWDSDPEVAKYTIWVAHKSVEETEELVTKWLKEEKENIRIRFVITIKGNDEPIGAIDTVHFVDGVPAIGYSLSRKYWNKGYMSEACLAFINYLFNQGYPKILICADKRNAGSLRVIEKCGFKFTHEEFLEHRSIYREESVTLRWYEMFKR